MAIKYNAVAKDIRMNILEGRWKPTLRIPTRNELIQRYDTSRATIQKAMDELSRDGFVISCGKSGTFVSNTPPNLNSIAIVFPATGSDSPAWDAMWSKLVSQKKYFEKRFKKAFIFYYMEQDHYVCKEYKRLLNDATEARLAGIIFPCPPSLNLIANLKKHNIPMSTITRRHASPGTATVWADYNSFFNKSLDYLQKCGRNKIALLTNVRLPQDYINDFIVEAKKRGLQTSDYWIQGISLDPYSPPWAVKLTRLMMQEGRNGRPDGLIIANENLIDYALSGLQQEGIIPGKDIDVAAQVNFPAARPNSFEIKRIGFDVRVMLDLCIKSIEAFKNRHELTHDGLVPAEYEDELTDYEPMY